MRLGQQLSNTPAVQPSFDSGVFLISHNILTSYIEIAIALCLLWPRVVTEGEKMSLYEGSCPQQCSVDLACHAVLIELELAVTMLFGLEHKPFQR